MIIECPQCNNKVRINDDAIQDNVFRVRCAACKELLNVSITISPVSVAVEENNTVEEHLQTHYASPGRSTIGISPESDKGKRIEQLRSSSPLAKAVLERLGAEVETLPVLPDVAGKIIAKINDKETSISDLTAIVQAESVIAARILRMANSAFYKSLNAVTDLPKAIVRIGFKQVQNIVLAGVAQHLFEVDDPSLLKIMKMNWTHSVASAASAREIAQATSFSDPETAFTAGLLQDIGFVVIIKTIAQIKKEQPRVAQELDENVLVELLDLLHGEQGARLAEQWEIPEEIAVVCRFHHTPANSEQARTLLNIAHLADLCAFKVGKPSFLQNKTMDPDVSLFEQSSTKELGLNDMKVSELLVDLEDKVNVMLDVVTRR